MNYQIYDHEKTMPRPILYCPASGLQASAGLTLTRSIKANFIHRLTRDEYNLESADA